MRSKDIRRPVTRWQPFEDEDFVHLIDIVSHQYGVLPSQLLGLDWFDLMFCVRCVVARGKRIKQITRGKKKTMIFPTMDISSLADILG